MVDMSDVPVKKIDPSPSNLSQKSNVKVPTQKKSTRSDPSQNSGRKRKASRIEDAAPPSGRKVSRFELNMPSNQTRTPKKDKPCFRFLMPRGCQYGDKCQFSHTTPKEPPVCRRWLNNRCKHSTGCQFRHDNGSRSSHPVSHRSPLRHGRSGPRHSSPRRDNVTHSSLRKDTRRSSPRRDRVTRSPPRKDTLKQRNSPSGYRRLSPRRVTPRSPRRDTRKSRNSPSREVPARKVPRRSRSRSIASPTRRRTSRSPVRRLTRRSPRGLNTAQAVTAARSPMVTCPQWLKGSCRKKNCSLLHSQLAPVCAEWQRRGACDLGDECGYRHPPSQRGVQRSSETRRKRDRDQDGRDPKRHRGGQSSRKY